MVLECKNSEQSVEHTACSAPLQWSTEEVYVGGTMSPCKFCKNFFFPLAPTLLDERSGSSRKLLQKGKITTTGMEHTDFVAVETVDSPHIQSSQTALGG